MALAERRASLSLLRGVAAVLLALLVAGGGPALAQAQPVLLPEVGHAGAIRRNHYFPIRVSIDWLAEPGEEVAGDPEPARLEVRLTQDAVNSVRISRDVTIQPGQRSSVIVHARSVVDVDAIEIELRGRGGRLLARSTPSLVGPGGWTQLEAHQAIVLVAGRSTLPRSGWVFDHQNVSPVKVAETAVRDLPRAWPGYDGVSLVVLEDLESQRLDAVQLGALLDWVRQGGHLAITATNQLDTFNQVIGELGSPLTFGEYGSEPFDSGLSEILRGAVALALDPAASVASGRGTRDLRRIDPNGPLGWYQLYFPYTLDELDRMQGNFLYRRPIELSRDALDQGWSARWATELLNPLIARADPEAAERVGDIVVGPLGLGSVTILGIDPASLAGMNARELRGVGWWHCLAHLESLGGALSGSIEESGGYYNSGWASADAILETNAINEMLDDLSRRFGVSHGLFGAISIALLLLVVLIGPVDYFLLRWLRREPVTWITCPLLVLLACAAIYFAQESVSYGRARASRISIVDAWSGGSRGMATSFTAISSARGGRYALSGHGEGVYSSPSCWNPPYWYYSPDQGPSSTVLISESASGARVVSMSVPLENVRWVQDRGPIDVPPITGSVRIADQRDEVIVDVTAPAPMVASVVAVKWMGRWFKSDAGGVELKEGRLVGVRIGEDAEAAQARRSTVVPDPWSVNQTSWLRNWSNDLSFQIPGHREIGHRLGDLGPGYAAIILSIDRRSEVNLVRDGEPVDTEWEESMLLRLIVPVVSGESAGEESQP